MPHFRVGLVRGPTVEHGAARATPLMVRFLFSSRHAGFAYAAPAGVSAAVAGRPARFLPVIDVTRLVQFVPALVAICGWLLMRRKGRERDIK